MTIAARRAGAAARRRVPFSYLDRQFAELDAYLEDIRALVKTGDFTLGAPVREFEKRFAALCGMPHAVGVGSGTEAIVLALRALGIGPGDEVITTPTTFIATVGAIAQSGATPVFVDSEDGFVIDPERIEKAVTRRTKAILPVHYTGNAADMPRIMRIARKRGLRVIEDACQSIHAAIGDTPVGSWGEAACFSLHPLKNLNVWGDAGVVVTRSAALAGKLRLWRNHGLAHRDESVLFGFNSRLDSLQAVVGNRLIGEAESITRRRIANARRLDAAFAGMEPDVRVPVRRPGVRHVFHLYMLRARRRDELVAFLNERGVEAKVHYPTPVHLQKAARGLGYKRGDFPKSEEDSRCVFTLPAHQHLTGAELDYMIEQVRAFYS